MTTDVDVQYFSHLNGLVLGNDWGDLIRLLDTCLVNGLPLTSITSASIDAQGDITLNLYAAHKCMLFQIIELTGFTPSELNRKYRIKGTPTANQLILKANHIGKSITTTGTAKLAPLGYDIIFRDTNDVKRVYRAKNPRSEHPFIRVDETISDGVNNYDSSYAKYAMVGLLENMMHIDDCENPEVLQLPFDPSDPLKNWKITGTGGGVVRGWCRWHWARNSAGYNTGVDEVAPTSGNRMFTLCGDSDAFYMFNSFDFKEIKQLLGCGLYESPYHVGSTKPSWFLMGPVDTRTASTHIDHTAIEGGWPLMYSFSSAKFLVNNFNTGSLQHVYSSAIMPARDSAGNMSNYGSSVTFDLRSGDNDIVSSGFYALQIPFADPERIRGTLKHIYFAGGVVAKGLTTPYVQDSAMYVYDGSVVSSRETGGCYFCLGDLE